MQIYLNKDEQINIILFMQEKGQKSHGHLKRCQKKKAFDKIQHPCMIKSSP
jgi:hypothetical protein